MRRMTRVRLTAIAVVWLAGPVQAEGLLVVMQKRHLNIAEIEQGNTVNRLRLRQVGVENSARVRQDGRESDLYLEQIGLENSANLRQTDRINRSVIVQGGESTYLTAYQNGNVCILQHTSGPGVYGRLGRRRKGSPRGAGVMLASAQMIIARSLFLDAMSP